MIPAAAARDEDNLRYWIWLSSLPGIGPVKAVKLINLLGSPKNVWDCDKSCYREMGFLSEADVSSLLSAQYRDNSRKATDGLERCGVTAITIKDGRYPSELANIKEPPIVIYVRGKIEQGRKRIAVVGSRGASPYGIKAAREISSQLAACGFTIISGLAKGVDTAAHEGALAVDCDTYAVLGCGPDVVYPKENAALFERIAEKGAVVSEYLPGTVPRSGNFPARNRIISGLSCAVVIIEAGKKSGALITADFAAEQGREVFAVPGSIFSEKSAGTNNLIKQGACLAAGAADILQELGICPERELAVLKAETAVYNTCMGPGPNRNMEIEDYAIYSCIAYTPVHLDVIAAQCSIEVHDAAVRLFLMEVCGLVEQLPGRLFRRKE